MLLPSRVRRRILRHAFEEALDEVRESRLVDATEAAGHWSGVDEIAATMTAGSVGAVADVALEAPYVGPGSLSAAYQVEQDPAMSREAVDPWAAVRRLEVMLARGLSVTELTRLRRRYAAQHHPDRVPAAMRDVAALAMADLNAKIDKAIAEARKRT